MNSLEILNNKITTRVKKYFLYLFFAGSFGISLILAIILIIEYKTLKKELLLLKKLLLMIPTKKFEEKTMMGLIKKLEKFEF